MEQYEVNSIWDYFVTPCVTNYTMNIAIGFTVNAYSCFATSPHSGTFVMELLLFLWNKRDCTAQY